MVPWLDLQLPVQSVPITTKVVSSNPVHGEVYLIQHYVIKFVSDLWQVGGFLKVQNITEILLKVQLSTIHQPTTTILIYIFVSHKIHSTFNIWSL